MPSAGVWVSCALALLVLSAGCSTMPKMTVGPPDELASLRSDFASGVVTKEFVDRLDYEATRRAGTPEGDEMRLLAGYILQKRHDYRGARRHYDQVIGSSVPKIATRARLQSGYIAIKLDSPRVAIEFFRAAHENAHNAESRLEADFGIGYALVEAGEKARGREILERVSLNRDYPIIAESARDVLQPGRTRYSIQVGVYRDADNASRCADRFRGRGELVEIEPTASGHFRVIVGEHPTARSAELHASTLADLVGESPVIHQHARK